MVHKNYCHEKSLAAPSLSPKLDLKPIVETLWYLVPEASLELQPAVDLKLSGAGSLDSEGWKMHRCGKVISDLDFESAWGRMHPSENTPSCRVRGNTVGMHTTAFVV